MKLLSTAIAVSVALFACSSSKTNEEMDADSTSDSTLPETKSSSAEDKVVENPPVTDPKNVVDYYKLLAFKHFVDPFVFTERQGKWVCTEDMGEEFDYQGSLTKVRVYPSIVDEKNGYLEIEDEGTGEGAVYTQVALFRKRDKSYLVALNYYSHGTDPSVLSGSPPKFFTWNGLDFTDVTLEVFPATPVSLFFSQGYKPPEVITYFKLPQLGRKITYFINKPGGPVDASALMKNKIEIEFDSGSDRFLIR